MAKGALRLDFEQAVVLPGSLMACMSASGECDKGQRSRDVHQLMQPIQDTLPMCPKAVSAVHATIHPSVAHRTYF